MNILSLSLCLSVSLSLRLSFSLSLCLILSFFLSLLLSVSLSLYLCICLFFCMYICLSLPLNSPIYTINNLCLLLFQINVFVSHVGEGEEILILPLMIYHSLMSFLLCLTLFFFSTFLVILFSVLTNQKAFIQ